MGNAVFDVRKGWGKRLMTVDEDVEHIGLALTEIARRFSGNESEQVDRFSSGVETGSGFFSFETIASSLR